MPPSDVRRSHDTVGAVGYRSPDKFCAVCLAGCNRNRSCRSVWKTRPPQFILAPRWLHADRCASHFHGRRGISQCRCLVGRLKSAADQGGSAGSATRCLFPMRPARQAARPGKTRPTGPPRRVVPSHCNQRHGLTGLFRRRDSGGEHAAFPRDRRRVPAHHRPPTRAAFRC